jgi:hypothetical protein
MRPGGQPGHCACVCTSASRRSSPSPANTALPAAEPCGRIAVAIWPAQDLRLCVAGGARSEAGGHGGHIQRQELERERAALLSPGFLFESLKTVRVNRKLRRQQPDCDLAAESGITTSIDFSRAACAEQVNDVVRTETSTRRQAQRRSQSVRCWRHAVGAWAQPVLSQQSLPILFNDPSTWLVVADESTRIWSCRASRTYPLLVSGTSGRNIT